MRDSEREAGSRKKENDSLPALTETALVPRVTPPKETVPALGETVPALKETLVEPREPVAALPEPVPAPREVVLSESCSSSPGRAGLISGPSAVVKVGRGRSRPMEVRCWK